MKNADLEWKLYICRACGLIYDEKEGDLDSGLAPGTRFEDIPDDWECPLCGVKKSDFELFERPFIESNVVVLNKARHSEPGLVIIGGGMAAWAMVEAIRQNDVQTPITLITACSGDIYHKPELSVAIARQLTQKGLVRESGIAAAQRLAVTLVANTFLIGVSSQTKSVRTTRGTFLFDHLIFAQGAQNQLPETIPAEWCWRINHLNSWSGLQKQLAKKAQRVAIVGAGMVGCELAENLSLAGHKVTLIYRSATPLNQLLPELAGKRFEQYLSSQGVVCCSNRSIVDVNRSDFGGSQDYQYEISFNNDEALCVDQIVVAAGLKVDERIPKMVGLNYQNGIVVDPSSLQTSQENIYALGDCISFLGEPCRFISPIPEQAKVIAAQIRGEKAITYQHQAPIVRIKVRACSLVLHGRPNKNIDWKKVIDDEDNLTMEQWEAGRLVSKMELLKAS